MSAMILCEKLVARLAAVLSLVLAALAPASSYAEAFTAADLALLPHYCRYTQSFVRLYKGQLDKNEGERYQAILGPTLHHLHHYCIGLVETNRATLLLRSGAGHSRRTLLLSAVGNYDYVIERAPADFVLLPEILTKKGENLFRLGRVAEATAALQRAIELKPDYWPPYAAFSDYFRDLKDFAKARGWLDKALAIDPNASALKSRRDQLATATGRSAKQPSPQGDPGTDGDTTRTSTPSHSSQKE